MRARLVFMCICALAMAPLAACSDTGDTGGSGGDGATGGNGGDGGMGCVCPEPNDPPSIVSQPNAEYPLSQIGMLNLDDPPREAAELPLEVIVRDPNIEQTLEYRLFLDSPPPPALEIPHDQGTFDPNGSVERPVSLAISYDNLSPGACHKIELVVVGQFASAVEPRRPVEVGDFDEVRWWIEVVDTDNPVITKECQ